VVVGVVRIFVLGLRIGAVVLVHWGAEAGARVAVRVALVAVRALTVPILAVAVAGAVHSDNSEPPACAPPVFADSRWLIPRLLQRSPARDDPFGRRAIARRTKPPAPAWDDR
jgi:hypothetical protein